MAILKYLKFIMVVALIFISHIFLINFLPYPLDRLNMIFFFLLWLIFSNSQINVYFAALFLGFFSELMISLPFGIVLSAMMASIVFITWFLRHIFTNRSPYIIFLAGALAIVSYRVLFLIVLTVFNIFSSRGVWPNKEMTLDIMWEALFTSLLLSISYLIISRFVKKLNPAYIGLIK